MSILARMGLHSALLSFLEMVVFFGVISMIYFVGIAGVHATATQVLPPEGATWGGTLAAWFSALPAWLWIGMGLGYVALLTVYWAPGNPEANEAELRAFLLLAGVLLVTGVVTWWKTIRGIAEMFWDLVGG